MSKHQHVYVVDDDPSARNGISRLLRTSGLDVCGYASASEFLADLNGETDGCLVLDSRMPGISGTQLQEELTKRGIILPTIIVTADDAPETRDAALKMKAAGFFRKPVDGTALLDAIKWALK